MTLRIHPIIVSMVVGALLGLGLAWADRATSQVKTIKDVVPWTQHKWAYNNDKWELVNAGTILLTRISFEDRGHLNLDGDVVDFWKVGDKVRWSYSGLRLIDGVK